MTCVSSDLEQHLVALLAKLERDAGVRDEGRPLHRVRWSMGTMFAEVRTLELWRAVIAECLACVFYVLLVCGAYSPWAGQPARPDRHVVISLVAGFSMTVLVHCFQQVSGSHINPAITLSLAVLRRVTPLRAGMYVLAQLGGGIAGAALLFGATSSGYSGELGSTVVSRVITVGQGFGVEFLLTFVVALAYFSSMCPHRTAGGVGHASVIIGMAYLAATLVGLPLTGASMNPARSLGPAFVMNSWDGHWVYWAGPILGAITAGFIHEFIFNPRRSPLSRNHSSEGGFELTPPPSSPTKKQRKNNDSVIQHHQEHGEQLGQMSQHEEPFSVAHAASLREHQPLVRLRPSSQDHHLHLQQLRQKHLVPSIHSSEHLPLAVIDNNMLYSQHQQPQHQPHSQPQTNAAALPPGHQRQRCDSSNAANLWPLDIGL